jgi:hypothetical protein
MFQGSASREGSSRITSFGTVVRQGGTGYMVDSTPGDG